MDRLPADDRRPGAERRLSRGLRQRPRVGVVIRAGSAGDAAALLGLFDDAVAWLVARGQPGQWGTQPFSERRESVARVTEWAAGGGLRVAEADDGSGAVRGAVVLGARPPWVAPAGEPERYVEALVTARAHAGQGIGTALVERCVRETRAAGVSLLRVDCWADAPGLVAWYERQGFRPTATFTGPDGRWRGQVLGMAV